MCPPDWVPMGTPDTPSIQFLARASEIGLAAFAGIVFGLHFLAVDKDPIDLLVSQYANSDFGWLMNVGFGLAGIGVLALSVGLWRSLTRTHLATAAVVLLAVLGIGFAGLGVFPEDVPLADGSVNYTFSGRMHGLSSAVMFTGLIVAVFVLIRVFAEDPRWERFAPTTRNFAWAILALFAASNLASVVTPPGTGGVAGLVQRVFGAVFVVWLFFTARRLRA
jgi:hypothetical membrane protein